MSLNPNPNQNSNSTARLLPVLLAFCMFSTGASGLVNEYVLATITTYILGNSIEQFSIVIASMMFMMGISGLVQSKMSDNNLIGKFVTVEVFMAILGAFSPLAIYGAYGYLTDHFLLVHYFFVLSVGFLIGFEIPLVMRIIEQNKIDLKTNLTLVYAMDYIGAFIGAIIWVKFLLKNYPLTEISFIVAGFNFFIALLTVIYFLHTNIIKKRWQTISLVSIAIVALAMGYTNNREISLLFEQKFYDDPVVYQQTTKYQHLVITENKKRGDIRLYINGNTQFSSLDEKRYHDLLVHPIMSLAKPEHVLILGGGDGLALREVLKYPDIESVTLVDLDPEMVKLAATNKYLRRINDNAFDDARLKVQSAGGLIDVSIRSLYLDTGETDQQENPVMQRVASVTVYNIDADQFIKKQSHTLWDAIIIDFPDPSSIELGKLYSKEFYTHLKKHLSPTGFVSIQSTSPYHAKEVFLSIALTLESTGLKTLPFRQNIPSFGDWGFHLAWNGLWSKDEIKKKIKLVDGFEVKTDFITADLMRASFAFGKGELESEKHCINTLMSPCLLTQYLDYSWQVD